MVRKAMITFYRSEVAIACCWGIDDARKSWKELYLLCSDLNSHEYQLMDFSLTNNGYIYGGYLSDEILERLTKDDNLANHLNKPPFNINRSFRDFLLGSKPHLKEHFIKEYGPIEDFNLIKKANKKSGEFNDCYYITIPFNLKDQRLALETEYRNIKVDLIQN